MEFKKVARDIFEHENPQADTNAKRLVVMASMHGNEPAGLSAFEYLKNTKIELSEGVKSVTLITGNPDALKQNVRAIDVDLNRVWNEQEDHDTTTIEYKRYLEIRPILFRAHTVLLDLHTTSSEHEPFIILDHPPTEEMIDFVSHMPSEFITYNWLGFIGRKTVSGGLQSYDSNTLSFAYELGQHASEVAKENAVLAVDAFLAYYNNSSPKKNSNQKWLKVIQQLDLPDAKWEWVKDEKGPFPISVGEQIGVVDGVAYHAPVDGFLIMPNKLFSRVNPDVCFFAVASKDFPA